MKTLLSSLLLSAAPALWAEPTTVATEAINALGIDLLRQSERPEVNLLLSPYSIQSVLTMAYAGAAGDTRTEMEKILHFPPDDGEVHRSFAALRNALNDIMLKSLREAERMQNRRSTNVPLTLVEASRMFGQKGYVFHEPFLNLIKDSYGAPIEIMDFATDPGSATKHINQWVETQTRERIRDLIPDGALDRLTRLVLVNAIYLKVPWEEEFYEFNTKPLPFYPGAGGSISVPTMKAKRSLGYVHRDGCTALTIPYRGGDLQLLVLLPDSKDGLAELERTLTTKQLTDCARLERREVILYLPKFKIEPPAMDLGRELQALGMKKAFDRPTGSANFDRIAPRRDGDSLYVSAVFHKTFLNLDEKGTEAAAATALAMRPTGIVPEVEKPIEVRVDHPFLFAIQHRDSGACLFLGHVIDPR